jgi:hypothetical protein
VSNDKERRFSVLRPLILIPSDDLDAVILVRMIKEAGMVVRYEWWEENS